MLLFTLHQLQMVWISVHAFRQLCPTKKMHIKQISTVYTQVQVDLNQSLIPKNTYFAFSHEAKQHVMLHELSKRQELMVVGPLTYLFF